MSVESRNLAAELGVPHNVILEIIDHLISAHGQDDVIVKVEPLLPGSTLTRIYLSDNAARTIRGIARAEQN